jgi:hypothetical protein
MLTIVIVQGINGGWGYCPKEARALLRPEQDEHAPYPSAREAVEAVHRDKTIPNGARIEVEAGSVADVFDAVLGRVTAGDTSLDDAPGDVHHLPLDPATNWPFR